MSFAPPGQIYGIPALSQSMESLSVGKKKKRPQRAYHETVPSSPAQQQTFNMQPPQLPFQGTPMGSPRLGSPFVNSPQAGGQFGNPNLGTPLAPHTPNGQFGQFATPNAQFNSPNAQFNSPNAQFNSPNAQFSSPNQFGTPNAQFNNVNQFSNGPGPNVNANATARSGQMAPPTGSDDLSVQGYRFLNQKLYLPDESGQTRSFLTFNNVVPPDATTQFHAVDQGTASSKFIRSTMYYVPESEQLRSATKLPLAVTIRPFAPVLETEEPIPVVDMRRNVSAGDPLENGPIRCRRCRSYVNPSMQFTNMGKFTCNICQFPNNVVPNDYHSVLDHQNQRIDKFSRPELHKGVYDLIVPQEYNFLGASEDSQPLHHIFLVDITDHSRKQNLPTLVADAIRATLYSEDVSPLVKYSIIAFDKRVHFFNLSANLDSCQLVVSSDLESPFIPFDEGLFVDPEESRSPLEDAFNYLERLSMDSGNVIADTEPCFGAACTIAMMCLQKYGGGKVTALLAALPSWGPGALKFKDNRAVGRTFSPGLESRILLPDSEYFKNLAADFVKHSVGLDVHVVSPTSVDLSNVGYLCSASGGELTRWPNFDLERDSRNLLAHFISSVQKTRGYQGQLKLRCSHGLQVTQYYCTSTTSDSEVVDPVIPVLNEDQTISILLRYDGKLFTKYDAHFQAALLYTDPQGIRKVRVINLVLAVSERLEDVFNFVDENAVVTTILRDSLSFVGKQTLRELRESVNEKLVEIFTQYRAMNELGRNAQSHNKLLFPDSITHLPIFLLSLTKTRALRDSATVSSDARLSDLFQLLHMPVERLLYRLYPALVELHSIEETECMFEPVNKFLVTPRFVDLSQKNLEPGVYIMYNGSEVYVYVDANANPLIVQDLFGNDVDDVSKIHPLIDEFPEMDTHISQQARNLVQYFQQLNGIPSVGSAGIRIVKVGAEPDGALGEFRNSLVEDSLSTATAMEAGPAYPEFLSNLHRAIKTKLENDKSSSSVKKSVAAAEHTNETLAQRLIHF